MAAADEIDYDIFEQIFIRLGVEDLTRCKCVSKSLYSLISTPCFVESHLKQQLSTYNDPKRITGKGMSYSFLLENKLFVVGSANGLVCVSPEALQLLVVNPYTRQTIKILEPPSREGKERSYLVWGFGYDSSNNDYKIVLGFDGNETSEYRTRSKKKNRKKKTPIGPVKKGCCTRFYVLSLKTCLWKLIGEYDYMKGSYNTVSGVFCDGALHWDMMNLDTKELTILSFDLSRDKITKTRLPDGCSQLECGVFYTLGVMEESLCLYVKSWSTKIWVLRRDSISGKQSWVLLPDNYVMNYNAVHVMNDDYSVDDTPHFLSNSLEHIAAPIYVRSLVSPHVNIDFSSKFVSGR